MCFLDLELNVVFKDSTVRREARGGKLIRQLVQFELIRRSGTRHQCCESLPSAQAADFPTHHRRLLPPAENITSSDQSWTREQMSDSDLLPLLMPRLTRGRRQIGIPFKGYRSVGDGMTIGCLHVLERLRLTLLSLEQSVPKRRQQRRRQTWQHAIRYESRSKLTQRQEATDV